MSPEEARRAALRAFGNLTLIREHTRALFRSTGFSLIAVLVMALCIGATTSMFTVMRSILLRPLPFRDPRRLVTIFERSRDPVMNAQEFNYNPVAPADFFDRRAESRL